MARKTKAEKQREKREQIENVKFAVDKVVELLKNPLVSGFVGYMIVTFLARMKDRQGKPVVNPTVASAMKGVAVGYPLGGLAGLAAGSAVTIGSQLSAYSSEDWLRGLSAIGGTALQGLKYLP